MKVPSATNTKSRSPISRIGGQPRSRTLRVNCSAMPVTSQKNAKVSAPKISV